MFTKEWVVFIKNVDREQSMIWLSSFKWEMGYVGHWSFLIYKLLNLAFGICFYEMKNEQEIYTRIFGCWSLKQFWAQLHCHVYVKSTLVRMLCGIRFSSDLFMWTNVKHTKRGSKDYSNLKLRRTFFSSQPDTGPMVWKHHVVQMYSVAVKS